MRPSAEAIIAAFSYDPETGVVTRLSDGKTVSLKSHGYLVVSFQRRVIGAHRIAWVIMTGDWAEGVVDHINHVKTDNRWSNLRDIPSGANSLHQPPKTGRGVRRTGKGGYRAIFKDKTIGVYTTLEEADTAYQSHRQAVIDRRISDER